MSASLSMPLPSLPSDPNNICSPLPTGLQIKIEEAAERTTVSVQGELDILTVPELRSVLRSCATKGDRSEVVLDLRELEFLDAHGLSALLECRRRLGARHRRLSITAPSACVRRVLVLTGLSELFGVTPAGPASR